MSKDLNRYEILCCKRLKEFTLIVKFQFDNETDFVTKR